MRSSYKRLGEYIELISVTNSKLHYGESDAIGVTNNKEIIQTIANNEGRDFSNFYIVAPDAFIYNSRTSRMGDKVGLGYNRSEKHFITSFNNTVFRVKNEGLLPMFLYMWFKRPEFDRYARFHSWGSSTEIFSWEEMCNTELPVPHIDKQRAIVKEYNTIVDRINLNNQLIQKLEETAQAIYKQWFVDFEFPDAEGKPYKSNGGEMEWNEELEMEVPKGWEVVSLNSFLEIKYGKDYKHLKSGTIPLYGSGGIMSYVNMALYTERSILIPRKGSLNNILLLDQPFWSVDTMFYSVLKEASCGCYVFYFLQKIDFSSIDVGSAVPSMTTEYLNGIQILKPLPNTLDIFDKIVSKLRRIKELKRQQCVSLHKFKDLLFSKLATIEN